MSINFEKPIDEKAMKKISKLFGDSIVAQDQLTTLLDNAPPFEAGEMTKLANMVKQSVTIEVNKEGDVKEMSDGTKYKVTKEGWRKTNPAS